MTNDNAPPPPLIPIDSALLASLGLVNTEGNLRNWKGSIVLDPPAKQTELDKIARNAGYGLERRDPATREPFPLSAIFLPDTHDYILELREIDAALMVGTFSEGMTLEEAVSFSDALDVVGKEDNRETITANVTRFFRGIFGSKNDYTRPDRRPLLLDSNIFPAFFWDIRESDLRGDDINLYYAPTLMFDGLHWLKDFGSKSGNEYLRSIAKDITDFLQTQASQQIETLIGSDTATGEGEIALRDYYLFKDQSNKGRKHSDLLTRIGERTYQNISQVKSLESALRRFEYLLAWRRFYDECKVGFCKPVLNADALEIVDGRNLHLVMDNEHYPDPATSVMPHSVVLSDQHPAILLQGSNGAGKTRLIDMIAVNTLLANRGLYSLSERHQTPPIYALAHGKDLSRHGETASSFQNACLGLKRELDRFTGMPQGYKGVLCIDELFAGTDTKDETDLILGTLAYCQEQGIYVVGASHANRINSYTDVLSKMNIKSGFFVLDRKTRGLRRLGRGEIAESEGIAAAEEIGLEKEVLEYAKDVRLQRSNASITLAVQHSKETAGQPQKERKVRGCSYTDRTLEELAVYKRIRGDSSSWESFAPKNLGRATAVFAKYSSYGSHYDSDSEFYPPLLKQDAADVFLEELARPLTRQEKEERRDIIQKMINVTNPLYTLDAINDALTILKPLDEIFAIYQNRKSRGVKEGIRTLAVGFGGGDTQSDWQAYQRFLTVFHPINEVLVNIQMLGMDSEQLDLPHDIISPLQAMKDSAAAKQLTDFANKYKILKDKERTPRDVGGKEFEYEDWAKWVNLCIEHRDTLKPVYDAILKLNFYAIVANTVKKENWRKVEYKDGIGASVEQAINLSLTEAFIRQKPKEQRVSPVDVDLDDKLVQIRTGSNMGGKTQSLINDAEKLFFGNQIGFVPAEGNSSTKHPKIGDYSFVYVIASTVEATQGLSKFQSELKHRLQKCIDDYKKLSSPSGGIIFIDEPVKWTSEEDAVPLLIGFMKYFERRGVQVVLSTHYSGVFEYLDKLDDNSRINYRTTYVEDPSLEGMRYKLKEGKGSSHGIDIAERLGLPKKLIGYARKARELRAA